MKKNTKIFLLFLLVQVQNSKFADDSTCDVSCDSTDFASSCATSTTIVSTTSVNADDPTALPVSPMFTTSDVQGSSNWDNITSSVNYLNMIIQACRSSHYISNLLPSYYYNTLQKLKGYLLPYALNDSDALLVRVLQSWYDNIISKGFVTDSTSSQQSFVIQSYAGAVTISLSSETFSGASLSSQQCILEAQQKCLDDAITCLNAEISQKNQDLETARQNGFTAFSNADLFIRGRLGVITNTSSIAYLLVDGDGNVLDTIAPNSSSSNTFALADYANTQQGSMFTLVPYDGSDEVVEDGSGEAFSYGGTFTILCNSVGMNSAGNPYGYSQSVSVTRVYPSGATRSHIIDVSTLVGDNQYWEFNVTINPLPANTQFVYPRISAVSSVTEELDVTVDFPTVLEAEMGAPTAITQSNSSGKSFPGFESDDYWSDVPA